MTEVALVGFASSATAADLPPQPVYRSAAVAVPVANWTGFYVGLGGGYGLYDADTRSTSTSTVLFGAPLTTSSPTATTGGKGYFGRVQIVYDYQFANQWLLGAFADWDFSSIKGTIADPVLAGLVPLKQTSAWGAGGRIGYLVTPQILTFFDGGYASARFKGGPEAAVFPLTPPGTPLGITLPNQTYSGYFLGGGTEIMIFPGWFAKSEYRLASYGAKTTTALVGPPATTGFFSTSAANYTVKPIVQTISAELVYKFNWGR